MPSTFFGLTIAASGLSSYQAALNTTANNLSNLQTRGYSRQQANRVASDALRVHQRYGSAGTGVVTNSIRQVRNLYYDEKYWFNQSYLGTYEAKLNYMQQIEDSFGDDGESILGFNSIFSDMFNALDTMKNQTGSLETRQQFIGKAQNLATYFNSVSSSLKEIQSSTNEEIKAVVMNINSIAEKIAILNKQINVIELQGGYANELRDQRALLVDELSKIVPTEVEELEVTNSNYPDMKLGGTYYQVKIAGQTLVDTFEYETLTCKPRENRLNQSDIDGLYDIKWESTGSTFNMNASSMTGTLKGLFDIRDGNNGEIFSGDVTFVEPANTGDPVNQVKVSNPSITAVEAMTMPEEGILMIGGYPYKYTGFSFEVDQNTGEVTSYTFTLEKELDTVEDRQRVQNQKCTIGSKIDAMGIPYYMAQMNMFLRSFASKFNDIMKKGKNLYDEYASDYSFFTGADKVSGEEYAFPGDAAQNNSDGDNYYRLTAENFQVLSDIVKDPRLLAASEDIVTEGGVDAYNVIEELAKLKSDTVLFRGGYADGFLKCMIADISVDTQESKIFYENFENIAFTIETQRQSISGVDEDEEGLDLVKFQNAYNLSSKMISVMSEIYDRLILETGV